ncbi:unannotated protein [freshwater metagenome]|uniref:Unannotated protein n=1 Tax=freshwater metagenome TaxID=449393 RepID=A0A6J6A666_9ZZZZ
MRRVAVLDRVLHGARLYDLSRRTIGASNEMRRLVGDVVRPTEGTRMLDFGCGNGRLVPFLPNLDYVGVDNNPSYIEQATATHGSDQVRFVCADVKDLPSLGFGEFDVVVSLGVLHHLSDEVAETAVTAVLQQLTPQGRLITMDPCFHPEQASLARVLMAMDRGRYVRHPEDYRRLVERCNGVVTQQIWHDVYKFPYTHCVQVVVRG